MDFNEFVIDILESSKASLPGTFFQAKKMMKKIMKINENSSRVE